MTVHQPLFRSAGTFSPEQVNCNGEFPNADGKKSLSRTLTVLVKALPPSPWSLYETHGNVFEGSADWYSDYPQGPRIGPSCPSDGVARVMRGWSWGSDAGD